MKYYLYILLTVNNTLYCGITNDLVKRYNAHLNKKGAKYTISNPPQKIVYIDEFEDKSSAMKEEYRIKKTLKRAEKLDLIEKNKERTKKIFEKIFMIGLTQKVLHGKIEKI